MIPQDLTEFPVEGVGGALAVNAQQPLNPRAQRVFHPPELGVVRANWFWLRIGQEIPDRIRKNEVTVGQPLHQRARAQPIGAVIRKVRLPDDMQSRNRAHQVVVHPQPAHRIVHRRVDPHRHLIGLLGRDPVVHMKQIAVTLLDRVSAQPLDRFSEVQVHPLT